MRMGERRGVYRVFMGKPEGKSHLEDLGMDGRSVLNGSARCGMGRYGLDWSG